MAGVYIFLTKIYLDSLTDSASPSTLAPYFYYAYLRLLNTSQDVYTYALLTLESETQEDANVYLV